ncbi:unknown [Ruminococcus sp. CAG:579]|nr:unknown [Ruminococcus sp. CAG:579]
MRKLGDTVGGVGTDLIAVLADGVYDAVGALSGKLEVCKLRLTLRDHARALRYISVDTAYIFADRIERGSRRKIRIIQLARVVFQLRNIFVIQLADLVTEFAVFFRLFLSPAAAVVCSVKLLQACRYFFVALERFITFSYRRISLFFKVGKALLSFVLLLIQCGKFALHSFCLSFCGVAAYEGFHGTALLVEMSRCTVDRQPEACKLAVQAFYYACHFRLLALSKGTLLVKLVKPIGHFLITGRRCRRAVLTFGYFIVQVAHASCKAVGVVCRRLFLSTEVGERNIDFIYTVGEVVYPFCGEYRSGCNKSYRTRAAFENIYKCVFRTRNSRF